MDSTGIIIIGNEILSGKVRDENSPFLIDDLRELGMPVGRVAVIPDTTEVIAEVVGRWARQFTHVVTCGGVGPTMDDVTFAGIADAFTCGLVTEPTLARIIREHLGDRVTEAHMRMALVPEGTELLWAEGQSWPVILVRNVMVLPGSPELVREKWTSVRERFRAAPFALRRVFLRIDEASIAADLLTVDAGFPAVQMGSYPASLAPVDHQTEVTFESKDRDAVERAVQAFLCSLEPNVVVRVE